jgi:hypothetical protein
MDDSGLQETGWALYGWVEVDIAAWRDGLRPWLDFRRRLNDECGIPVHYELHMTKFLGASHRPSNDQTWNEVYENRWKVITAALDVIASTECLSVGTVYRYTDQRGRAFRREQADLYLKLVQMVDQRLADAGDTGIIVMDGDGTDDVYLRAHRQLKLSTRALVEDPLFQHSHRNQWMQIADLVSYAAYQGLLRAPIKQFAWDWYSEHLTSVMPEAAPQPL